jgi:hypothetical protein
MSQENPERRHGSSCRARVSRTVDACTLATRLRPGQQDRTRPDSKTELVLSTNLQYAPNWLVTSVQDAVADIVAAGGTVLVEPHEILVGRLAVVADPFGNALILLDRPSVATPPTQRAALQPWARAHDHPRSCSAAGADRRRDGRPQLLPREGWCLGSGGLDG